MRYDKTLGTVSRESNVSVPTLRLYADSGLIPCIRDSVGRRLFPESAVEAARRVRKERTRAHGAA